MCWLPSFLKILHLMFFFNPFLSNEHLLSARFLWWFSLMIAIIESSIFQFQRKWVKFLSNFTLFNFTTSETGKIQVVQKRRREEPWFLISNDIRILSSWCPGQSWLQQSKVICWGVCLCYLILLLCEWWASRHHLYAG